MEYKKFEYQLIEETDKEAKVADVLNEEGQEGWELVQIIHGAVFIFKRQIITQP